MTKLTEIGAYMELGGGSVLAYIAVAKEQTLCLLFVQWIQLIQLNESSKIINSRNFQIAYCTWTLGRGGHTVSLRLCALGAVHKLRRIGRERGDLGANASLPWQENKCIHILDQTRDYVTANYLTIMILSTPLYSPLVRQGRIY